MRSRLFRGRVALALLVVVILSTACGTGVKVAHRSFLPLRPDTVWTVEPTPVRQTGRNDQRDLATLFRWTDAANGPVTIRTDSLGGITIGMGGTTRTYPGNLSPRGFYEVYLERDITEVPPLVPIIYSKRHVSRLRMAMTRAGELVIDHRWANDGNIFLLAGGGSGRTQYFFRPAR